MSENISESGSTNAAQPSESGTNLPPAVVGAKAVSVVISDDRVTEVNFYGARGRFFEGKVGDQPLRRHALGQGSPRKHVAVKSVRLSRKTLPTQRRQVAQVLLAPRQGVVLWLEGVLNSRTSHERRANRGLYRYPRRGHRWPNPYGSHSRQTSPRSLHR